MLNSKRIEFVELLRKVTLPFRGRGLGKIPILRKVDKYLFDIILSLKGPFIAERNGIKMWIIPRDYLICRPFFFHGIYEKSVTEYLKKTLKEGMCFVDVGANMGYFTLLGAKMVGMKGKVFAFEPEPKNYELLKENVKINNLQNISLVQAAVSYITGEMEFYVSPTDRYIHSLTPFDNFHILKVKTISLDDFFVKENVRIDVIKMDIEGEELNALRGMKKILERSPKLKIISEFFPTILERKNIRPSQYFEYINEIGLDVHLIMENGNPIPINYDEAMKICDKQFHISLLLNPLKKVGLEGG